MLGYTAIELREHLASRFSKGMSFDNYGKWHIDHIRPIASYRWDVRNTELIKEMWALKNLQPLWREDNIKKGAKWEQSRQCGSASGLPAPKNENITGTKLEQIFV